MKVLKRYLVDTYWQAPGQGAAVCGLRIRAENVEDACAQALRTYPGGAVVDVFRLKRVRKPEATRVDRVSSPQRGS